MSGSQRQINLRVCWFTRFHYTKGEVVRCARVQYLPEDHRFINRCKRNQNVFVTVFFRFLEDISKVLGKCGITFSLPRRTVVLPDRSFVLYLILTIITLGLFGIYWLYVLLKDPNEHFKHHILVEDQLFGQLESLAI